MKASHEAAPPRPPSSSASGGLVLGILAAAGPAHGQLVRLVDEDGVIHYTNEPCQPRYARLASEACAQGASSPPPDSTPAVASGPAPLPQEIERTATRHGVDPRLVAAVVRGECAGDPGALSPKGAQGLMQLMPSRARTLGVRDAFDPVANLDGGVRHLRELLARYAGNVPLALVAYNADEEAVRAHGGIPPYPETQAYVRKILALHPRPVPHHPGIDARQGSAPGFRAPTTDLAKSVARDILLTCYKAGIILPVAYGAGGGVYGEFGAWWEGLDEDEQESLYAAVILLETLGPNLRHPQSSGVETSRHGHMRELRVQHRGRPYRVRTRSTRGASPSSSSEATRRDTPMVRAVRPGG